MHTYVSAKIIIGECNNLINLQKQKQEKNISDRIKHNGSQGGRPDDGHILFHWTFPGLRSAYWRVRSVHHQGQIGIGRQSWVSTEMHLSNCIEHMR